MSHCSAALVVGVHALILSIVFPLAGQQPRGRVLIRAHGFQLYMWSWSCGSRFGDRLHSTGGAFDWRWWPEGHLHPQVSSLVAVLLWNGRVHSNRFASNVMHVVKWSVQSVCAPCSNYFCVFGVTCPCGLAWITLPGTALNTIWHLSILTVVYSPSLRLASSFYFLVSTFLCSFTFFPMFVVCLTPNCTSWCACSSGWSWRRCQGVCIEQTQWAGRQLLARNIGICQQDVSGMLMDGVNVYRLPFKLFWSAFFEGKTFSLFASTRFWLQRDVVWKGLFSR